MQKKTNWLAVSFMIMTALFLVTGSFLLFKPAKEVIPDGYSSSLELGEAIQKVSNEKNSEISELNTQISDLNTLLSEKVEEITEEVEEAAKESLGYLIDKIFFRDPVKNQELSDREVKTLFDDEIRFNGEDYDAEEVLTLNGLEVLCNEEDFKGEAYLTVPVDSINYTLIFENSLNTSEIGIDEETMNFNFLGQEIEVSKWDGDKVTLSKGEEILMSQEETKTIGEKIFTLLYVMEDSIFVDVNGETKEIDEGKTKTVNDLEIEVKNVIYSEAGAVFKAVLVLGEEVTAEIRDGDEYSEDSIWEYEINAHSIGIVLKEEFMELDDELVPLKAEETICLPNDYVCVRYNGVLEEDFEEISFELDTKNTVDYVEVKGNFQSGLADFDKLYINRTDGSIYDEDLNLIIGTITIGDSDNELISSGTKIHVDGDFNVNYDLTEAKSQGIILDDEEDYRTEFGILVENPEDSIDDQEWKISVPNEKLESTLTIL